MSKTPKELQRTKCEVEEGEDGNQLENEELIVAFTKKSNSSGSVLGWWSGSTRHLRRCEDTIPRTARVSHVCVVA